VGAGHSPQAPGLPRAARPFLSQAGVRVVGDKTNPKGPRPLPSEPFPCPRQPPCHVLLDPDDGGPLPDHVSAEVALASTWVFAGRAIPQAVADAFDTALQARGGQLLDDPGLTATDLRLAAFCFAWRIDWPLLVGPATERDLDHLLALAQLVLRGWGLDGPPAMVPLPGPFVSEPGARAGFVLERRTTEGRVVLFGLVREARTPAVRIFAPTPNQPWRFEWVRPPEGTLREAVVLQEGAGVRELAERLRRWYDQHLLGRVVRGRPLGSGAFSSRQECLTTLRDAVQTLRQQGKRPTQQAVADLLSEWGLTAAAQPLDTLLYWLRHYGISWRDVVG
jgi:hypothetical protein